MKKLLLILLLLCNVALANTTGLSYTVCAAGGPTPTRTCSGRTILATGVSQNINFDWGGGGVMGTGRGDGVLVNWQGFILWPGTSGQQTVFFYSASDDGFSVAINGTYAINSWREQGASWYNGSGSMTLTAGQVYAVDIWYYENGGGAAAFWYWNTGSGIVLVPSTNLATTNNYWVPSLCCGGSSAPITIDLTHSNRLNTFTNRTTNDSRVYVEQIGNFNEVTIQQTGTRNNYLEYTGNGMSNDVNVTQSGNASTTANYIDLNVSGSNNTVNMTQTSTGGTKSMFVDVQNNNNNVNIQQKDNGSHYIDLTITGGSKNIDILQQGSAAHRADITLTGASPRDLSLTQTGTTQQSYSINSNCTSSCQPITVIQGQ
jgi:hypothetical protein